MLAHCTTISTWKPLLRWFFVLSEGGSGCTKLTELYLKGSARDVAELHGETEMSQSRSIYLAQ